MVGNLPYNISTPLLFHLLEYITSCRVLVFMLQKEVVNRICAAPGSGDYGRLSVMVQSRCHTEALFEADKRISQTEDRNADGQPDARYRFDESERILRESLKSGIAAARREIAEGKWDGWSAAHSLHFRFTPYALAALEKEE